MNKRGDRSSAAVKVKRKAAQAIVPGRGGRFAGNQAGTCAGGRHIVEFNANEPNTKKNNTQERNCPQEETWQKKASVDSGACLFLSC